jgi:hypothetical protein
MEILESQNIELVGHSDLNGSGDGMQIMLKDDTLYVGHMGYNGLGTSILDVSDPEKPRVVKQIPIAENTHSHKVQLAGDILLVNHEQQLRAGTPHSAGLAVYDVSKPTDPVQIGFLPINGKGIHRIWWTGDQYAYFSVREVGYRERFLMTVDMSDPADPQIVSRWWYPGQWEAGGEEPSWGPDRRLRAHHVIVRGKRAYGGYGDGGMMIFSVNDGHLELLSQRSWFEEVGGNTHTHTVLPLLKHNLVAVTDEPLKEYCEGAKKVVRVFDITNEREPVQIGTFPEPEGDFCERGGRFGPHNFHENRPGSFVSEDILFLTYFNAGLRMYDISDPSNIREIGAFVPAAPPGQKAIQINDIYVSKDGLIYVTDRLAAGVFILRPTIDLQ